MSYLDILPAAERAKIRQQLRSPEAYEALREKVKGPEDLEREMKFNEQVAELKFSLETEPELQERAQELVKEALGEELEAGDFEVRIEPADKSVHENLVVIPEGNVAEKLPLKQTLSDQLITALLGQ